MHINSSKHIGSIAESRVALFLQSIGYEIIAKNWRTRSCEIDVIAKHKKTIYFIEVRYRSNGLGLESIDGRKYIQMLRASYEWSYLYQWTGRRRICVAHINNLNEVQFTLHDH